MWYHHHIIFLHAKDLRCHIKMCFLILWYDMVCIVIDIPNYYVIYDTFDIGYQIRRYHEEFYLLESDRKTDWCGLPIQLQYVFLLYPNHPGLEGVSSVKNLIDHITSIHIQLPSIRIYPLSSDTLSTCSWHEHDPLVGFFLGLRCVFPLSGEQQRLVTTAGQPRIQPHPVCG